MVSFNPPSLLTHAIVYVILAVPSGPPTNISTVTVGPNSVTLMWSAPDKRASNGNITGYVVTITPFQLEDVSVLVTETKYIDIVHLNPYSIYTISVAAKTVVGIGPFSQHLHVTTAEAGDIN